MTIWNNNNSIKNLNTKFEIICVCCDSIPNKEKSQCYRNMHSSQLTNKRSKHMPKNLHYHLICLKCHNFYIGSKIRPLYIRIKEHLNTSATSFHKHLIKCKNNNFFIKIEAIVHNVGNLRIKEALLKANLHPQINSRLELNTEYIIN